MVEHLLDGKVVLHAGDCIEVMRTLPEASVDAIVCDPPYGLTFMGKEWDGADGFRRSLNIADAGRESVFGRTSRTSPEYRGTALFQQWCETWAHEALRVLKPGAHLVAFSGTRTYHRMVCAIEDAGFEIRDQIQWVYGSGFPKSLDVAKAIDKAAGVEPVIVPKGEAVKRMIPGADQNGTGSWIKDNGRTYQPGEYVPTTPAAQQWQGWGTALKPSNEPICLARKPLIGTVAQNVQTHGTGALNVDGCRIETGDDLNGGAYAPNGGRQSMPGDERNGAALGMFQAGKTAAGEYKQPLGRFPANLIHDGSDEVLACFPDAPGQQGDVKGTEPSRTGDENTVAYGKFNGRVPAKARRDGEASANRRYTGEGGTNFAALPGERRSDGASASRFFYTSKADSEDRIGSKHPTVKPVDLMQWLVRLVTPKGGVVLDPFAGTGTTGEAAWREGMRAILIEREPEYQDDIRRRMDLVLKPTKRAAVAKTKGKIDEDAGPLFAEVLP